MSIPDTSSRKSETVRYFAMRRQTQDSVQYSLSQPQTLPRGRPEPDLALKEHPAHDAVWRAPGIPHDSDRLNMKSEISSHVKEVGKSKPLAVALGKRSQVPVFEFQRNVPEMSNTPCAVFDSPTIFKGRGNANVNTVCMSVERVLSRVICENTCSAILRESPT